MFVDTHMHEMTCSKDSFLKLEEMVEIAREKGLGARICSRIFEEDRIPNLCRN